MTLSEAMALMDCAKQETRKARAARKDEPKDTLARIISGYYAFQIPSDFYVVTTDGTAFGLMFFFGQYDSYTEIVCWSESEWDAPTAMDWYFSWRKGDGDGK